MDSDFRDSMGINPEGSMRWERAPRWPAPPAREAYLRLATLPGEVAQVDWGSFGTMRVGRSVRALSAFVLVLGYSRVAVMNRRPPSSQLWRGRRISRISAAEGLITPIPLTLGTVHSAYRQASNH
jgi:hypothetical protein